MNQVNHKRRPGGKIYHRVVRNLQSPKQFEDTNHDDYHCYFIIGLPLEAWNKTAFGVRFNKFINCLGNHIICGKKSDCKSRGDRQEERIRSQIFERIVPGDISAQQEIENTDCQSARSGRETF